MLTDFGARDSYVASMRGAVLSLCREAILVDISHDVSPQNVSEAAFILEGCRHSFPDRTVFLVVVDPGVGTQRRGLVVTEDRKTYVGPDNGVFDDVLGGTGVVAREIREPSLTGSRVAPTFHGRDVFAPVAAHLAVGTDPSAVGPVIGDPVRLSRPGVAVGRDGLVVAGVIHVDHFGNLVTNLAVERSLDLSLEEVVVTVTCAGAERHVPVVATYGNVPPGKACAVVGSSGLLEVGVNGDHAARCLGLGVGSTVRVRGLPSGALAGGML
jgi:S-adenosylmethionine hydrolase